MRLRKQCGAVNFGFLSCWDHPDQAGVDAWPLVKLHQAELSSLKFEPYRVRSQGDATGDALWIACRQTDTFIGLAFAWHEVAPGILAMGDMLAITTNVLLLSENGVLAPSVQAAQCVRLVQSLPWRAEVLRRLQP